MPTIARTLRSTARRIPDTVALIFGEQRTTYGELDARVDRTATALARLRLAKGDRFAAIGHAILSPQPRRGNDGHPSPGRP